MCILLCWHEAARAQGVRSSVHYIGPPALEVVPDTQELFLLNRIPMLGELNRWQRRLDTATPLRWGVENFFLSDWLDKGADDARSGLQIEQNYFVQWMHEAEHAGAGIGFEYFQIDTTGHREAPSTTLERDFIVYAPLQWRIFYVSPFWDTFIVDDSVDKNELGSSFSIDTFLNPSCAWTYNFNDRGAYFEWGVSHSYEIVLKGEKLGTLNGSMAIGMDAHQRTTITTLSSIDWGLDLNVPLTQRFFITGLLHFTKSLSGARDEDGKQYYEDIIPWAGLKLAMVF
jgi:hypothetical protein